MLRRVWSRTSQSVEQECGAVKRLTCCNVVLVEDSLRHMSLSSFHLEWCEPSVVTKRLRDLLDYNSGRNVKCLGISPWPME